MKIRAINFVDRKIENCYDYQSYDILLPDDWVNMLVTEQITFLKKYIDFSEIKNINDSILINVYKNGEELDEYELLHIFGQIASSTMTTESTDRGYLSIPKYFGDKVYATVEVQKNLGNYKNIFKHLQIRYIENGIEKGQMVH